jgi:hypothetical protein
LSQGFNQGFFYARNFGLHRGIALGLLATTDAVGSDILPDSCPVGKRQRFIDGVVEIQALP